MKPIAILITVSISSLLLTGCTTTRASRQQALQNSHLISEYHAELKTQLEKLNHSYQETFNSIMEEYDRDLQDDLFLQMDSEAQAASDGILLGWPNKSVLSELEATVNRLLSSDLQRLENLEASLASARLAYANAYKELSVNLAKLNQVRELQESLALDRKDYKVMRDFAQAVYKATQDHGVSPAPTKSPAR